MRHTRHLNSGTCVMGLIASLPLLCAAQAYSIAEIPEMTHARGVNRDGVVVGEKIAPATPEIFYLYVHGSGVVNELPQGFAASDINDLGQIIGSQKISDSPPVAAVLNVSGGEKLLTSYYFLTLGHAISNSGLFAVGQGLVLGSKSQFFFTPFLWGLKDDSLTHLPLLSIEDINLIPVDGDAHAVNDQGVVVGNSGIRILDALGNPTDIAIHAAMWQHGIVDLGTLPGGMNSDATGINDRGEIVGASDTQSGVRRAFLIRRSKMLDLGTLGHDSTLNSSANRINDHDEIVGWSEIRSGGNSIVRHAFVSQGGHLRDLTQLIAKGSPLSGSVTLTSANAISSNRWIAADGFDVATGELHAYLLIPHGH